LILTAHAGDVWSQAVTWQRTYGEGNIDYGYSIVQTPDEGYIAVGRKRIETVSYMFAMRLNKFGDTIWTKTYPGFSAYSIKESFNNTYIICGSSFIKIDINGNIIWSNPQNFPYPRNFLPAPDKGFYLISYIITQNSDYPILLKLDSLGNFEWSKIYNQGIAGGFFNDLTFNSNGNIILTGDYSKNLPLSYKLFVMQTDLKGNQIFFKGYDSLSRTYIQPDINNGFFLCGNTYGFVNYISKCDSNGNIIWKKKYDNGPPEYSLGSSFIKTFDNGFALTGTYQNGNFNYFIKILKADSIGNEQWRKLYGFNDNDDGKCIIQTNDSGFAVIGIRDNFNLGDIYIIKTDKTGFANPPVSINNINTEEIKGYILFQNYPNPFNPKTIINYKCSMYNDVSLKVFDVLGNEVDELVNEKQNAGSYSVIFDGSNFPSGVYFYKLDLGAGEFVETRRMVLLK